MSYSPASSLITLRYYTRITHIYWAYSYLYIFILSVSSLDYPPLFNLANTYSSFCTQLRYYPLHIVFSYSPKLSKVLPCYTPVSLSWHFSSYPFMGLSPSLD